LGLAHRVIPTLLCKGRTLVKGQRFEPWRGVGLAVQGVRINAQRGVDEVVLIDVSATSEGRTIDPAIVAEISANLFTPLAVGGGISSIEQVQTLLRNGADSVIIGSAAWQPTKNFVRELSEVTGAQAVIVSVDVRAGIPTIRNGTYPISVTPEEYAAHQVASGAGEILLTSVDREGTMEGYDLALIKRVAEAVNVPVIAHGGCSGYEDMARAIDAGAAAVAAGALFQFTEATPRAAAAFLATRGLEVRA
jgi:cyclase